MLPSLLLSFVSVGLSSALSVSRAAQHDLHTIHQFPNNTWIENMAIRSNGQILGTDIVGSKIYLVDPQCPQSEPPVVSQFPKDTCITGIVEVEEDVFYVLSVVGQVYTFAFNPNSSAIWKVDMRDYHASGKASLSKLVDTPEMMVPNGGTLLSERDGTILIADSPLGAVWRLNVNTKAYEVVFRGPYLAPVKGDSPSFGANGVRVVGSTLYFSNTNQGLIGKVPISADGRPTGSPTILTDKVPTADDFAVDVDGSVYVAENESNTLVRVSPKGQVEVLAGGKNSNALFGPVSARFGRGPTDRRVLYVSTDGLSFGNSSVPLTTAGKIAAIDVGRW